MTLFHLPNRQQPAGTPAPAGRGEAPTTPQPAAPVAGASAPTFRDKLALVPDANRFPRLVVQDALAHNVELEAVTMSELRAQCARYQLAGDEVRAHAYRKAIQARVAASHDDDLPPAA